MLNKKIPTNLEECFQKLEMDLPLSDLKAISQMSKQQLYRLHHGLGRWIRNNWKLWQGGPLKDYFNGIGLHHPDDMSGVIIESFWHHLRDEPLEIERQVKEYQDFWKNRRINE